MPIQRKFMPAAFVADGAGLSDRQIMVIASDDTIDRAGDVLLPMGCLIENYNKNPIVLADHDTGKPIGTAQIFKSEAAVRALITFAPAGISHKADEYCGLAKAGVLGAVSVGFNSDDYEQRQGGGILFKTWELMELSVVAVPCNPAAIVVQRSISEDRVPVTKADEDWKVGASRGLPVDTETKWDGPAAAKRILDDAGFDGDSPDSAKARKGFLAYDASNPGLCGSYKLPFADLIDGKLTALKSGIDAAASRLPQTDIPDDVAKDARAVLDHYEEKMTAKSQRARRLKSAGRVPVVKDLYDVAQLAYLMSSFGYLHQDVSCEAICEGDGSTMPDQLLAILHDMGDALIAMTREEVAEAISAAGGADEDEGDDLPADDAEILTASATVAQRRFALGYLRSKHAAAIAKSGKKISAATAAALQDSLDQHEKGMDMHRKAMREHTKAMACVKALLDEPGDDQDATDTDGNGQDEATDDQPKPDEGSKNAAHTLTKEQRIRAAEALALRNA